MSGVKRVIGKAVFVLALPFLAIFGSRRERVRVLVTNRLDEVLLVQSSVGWGEWELPGGGIKSKESPSQAAVRELREEVGVLLEDHQLLELGVTTTNHRIAPLQLRIYHANYDSITEIKPCSYEIAKVAWWPVDRLPKDKNNHFTEMVEVWRKRTY